MSQTFVPDSESKNPDHGQKQVRGVGWQASLPWLYTLIGPGIGSFLVAYVLIAFGMPTAVWVQLAGLLLISLLLGVGLLHGTTLALLLGYVLGFWGILVWIPAIVLANFVGIGGAKYWLSRAGNIDALLAKNTKAKGQIAKLERQLGRNGTWAIFWFRMSPIVPFALGTMVLARTSIRLRSIVLMGLLGAVPRTLVVMQIGMLATDIQALLAGKTQPTWSMAIGLVLLIISGLGLWVWGQMQLRAANNQRTDTPSKSQQ